MALLPGAVISPEPEIVIAGRLRWQIMGHHLPGAAGSQDIEDAIDNVAKAVFARTARSSLPSWVLGRRAP